MVRGAACDELTASLAGRVAFAAQDPLTGQWARRLRDADPALDLSPITVTRRSVYDGRWHLIVEKPGAARLYDADADPGELKDVAAEHPADVERLRALLTASPTR